MKIMTHKFNFMTSFCCNTGTQKKQKVPKLHSSCDVIYSHKPKERLGSGCLGPFLHQSGKLAKIESSLPYTLIS